MPKLFIAFSYLHNSGRERERERERERGREGEGEREWGSERIY